MYMKDQVIKGGNVKNVLKYVKNYVLYEKEICLYLNMADKNVNLKSEMRFDCLVGRLRLSLN